MAIACLEGAWTGHTAYTYKRIEESARVGVNPFMMTSAQTGHANDAVHQVGRALEAANVGSLSFATKLAVWLTPLATTILTSMLSFENTPNLKEMALYFQSIIGRICQTAIVVSSIALCYFGHPIMGATTLAFVLFEFAQAYFDLPFIVNKSFNNLGFATVNTARMVLGGFFEKLTALVEVGSWLYEKLWNTKQPLPEAPTNTSLTVLEADRLGDVEFDPYHYNAVIQAPPPPDISLTQLNKLASGVNWNDPANLELLKKKLQTDHHWKAFWGARTSDKDLIRYVVDGIKNFAYRVENHALKNGEYYHYEALQNKAKWITQKIQEAHEQKDRERLVSNLIEVGLASYYCPAGHKRAVDELFFITNTQLIDQLDLPGKIRIRLETKRMQLFHMFLYDLQQKQPGPLKQVVDPADYHYYSLFRDFLGDEFEIADAREENTDPLSFITSFDRIIFKKLYGSIIRPFVDDYNIDSVIGAVKNGYASAELKPDLFQQWFVSEYKEVNVNPFPKDDPERNQKYHAKAIEWYKETVMDTTDMVDFKWHPKDQYLKYMLVKFGIFKPKSAAAAG